MAAFLQEVLGLRLCHAEHDQWVLQLPDGSKIEVFGSSKNTHFGAAPVVEFFTDDLAGLADELRAHGIPSIFGPCFADDEDDAGWLHVRAATATFTGSPRVVTSRHHRLTAVPCRQEHHRSCPEHPGAVTVSQRKPALDLLRPTLSDSTHKQKDLQ